MGVMISVLKKLCEALLLRLCHVYQNCDSASYMYKRQILQQLQFFSKTAVLTVHKIPFGRPLETA